MPPTPNDAKRFSDKNRNNPKEIFKRLIDTTITQISPHGSYNPTNLRTRVTKQILSRHLAVQLSNHDEDIMITGGTSLMLRAPNAKVTEDLDIITYFYPTKEEMDDLCRIMSKDSNDPFTYTCRHKGSVKSRPGESYEINVYLNGEFQSTIKIDAVKARGSELSDDKNDFNDNAVEKLQVRDPLLISHHNNQELTTLKLLSPEKYLAGKIAGLFPIYEGKLQEVLRWKDLRDIMILATSVPIDADKFKDALTKLVKDTNDKQNQQYKFVIPKQIHIEELLEQARENRSYINDGFKMFYQPDRFSVETMVRVMSDLLLEQVTGFVWDLGVHDPQLQELEGKNKTLRGLSLPELRSLDLHGWRERNDTDINKPPKKFDGETNHFIKTSTATLRNGPSHANTLDNSMTPTTRFGMSTELTENPAALQTHDSPWAQGIINTDPLNTITREQPYNKSETSQAETNMAGYLIEGGPWNGKGLGDSTTRNPPELPKDNPPANSQDNRNDNDQSRGLNT